MVVHQLVTNNKNGSHSVTSSDVATVFNFMYTKGMSVLSHIHFVVSWTAIRWQETQIHRIMRTYVFNHKFECENTALLRCYAMSKKSSVDEGNVAGHRFNVNIPQVSVRCKSNYNNCSDCNKLRLT